MATGRGLPALAHAASQVGPMKPKTELVCCKCLSTECSKETVKHLVRQHTGPLWAAPSRFLACEMGNTNAASLDRNDLPLRLKRSVILVDEIVCSDGPVFPAMRRIFGKFDYKDLADLVVRAPIPVILDRFENLPQNAFTQDFEKAFQDCFYPGFPDLIEWNPPDIPRTTPVWLTDDGPQGSHAVPQAGTHGEDILQQPELFAAVTSLAGAPDSTDLSQPILRSRTTTNCSIPELTRHEENKFAQDIILLWKNLGRKTLSSIVIKPRTAKDGAYQEAGSSLVDVPWGFIIPGGRFREMYYWDSYWTIRGLLYSGMISTARGIILNFTDLIRRFGFIPNGTRSYYLTRSQPPVFSMMLSAYHAFTGDLELIRNTYMDVQHEYLYWLEGDARQVCVTADGKDFFLSRYLGHVAQPRTESWENDVAVVREAHERARTGSREFSDEDRSCIFRSIRAAAESGSGAQGWDFSSRWVPHDLDAAECGVMANLRTESFLPVDLNSFLYHAELYLFFFGKVLSRSNVQYKGQRAPEFFYRRANERREAMLRLLWNEEASWWFDFDISKGRQSRRVTSAGVAALLMQLHSPVKLQACRLFGHDRSSHGSEGTCTCLNLTPAEHDEEKAAHREQVLSSEFLVEKSGLWSVWGLSTTQFDTGQQWDGANCWPPLLQMAVEAMIELGSQAAVEAVKSMTDRYIFTCMQAYKRLGALPEKSCTATSGSCGAGGGYKCQTGFGWSIGVALELLFVKRASFCAKEVQRRRRKFGSASYMEAMKAAQNG